jgi:ribosomal protein L34E
MRIARTSILTEGSLHSYNTRSNRTRVVKTPGGDLRLLHIKKRGTVPKCGDCGSKLSGVSTTATSIQHTITTRNDSRHAIMEHARGTMDWIANNALRRIACDVSRDGPIQENSFNMGYAGVSRSNLFGHNFFDLNQTNNYFRSPLSAPASTPRSPSPRRPSSAPTVVRDAATASVTASSVPS